MHGDEGAELIIRSCRAHSPAPGPSVSSSTLFVTDVCRRRRWQFQCTSLIPGVGHRPISQKNFSLTPLIWQTLSPLSPFLGKSIIL